MTQEKPLGVALIGLGMVAGTYVRALADLTDSVTLRGVHARSPEARAAFLAQHGLAGARDYPSVAAIAADPEVDFAILATPPNARAEAVDLLSAAGKAILMEKPVERTLGAAEALVDLCEARAVPLGIVLQHRIRPSAVQMRALVATGTLGPLQAAEIAVPWWRPQSYYDVPGRGSYGRDGGGVMISQAIHTMDLALSLTGPVAQVTAMAATTGLHRMEAEDWVTAGLRFADGAVGTLFATTAAYPGRAETIRLHYARASVALESNALTVDWHDGRSETFGASETTGAGADPMAFTHAWHRDLIADFAGAVAQGRAPLVTGRAALAVHRLIASIETAARTGHRTDVAE